MDKKPERMEKPTALERALSALSQAMKKNLKPARTSSFKTL
ncbi:MAG: hypothetical protein NWE89_05420 [Candidatus Bathyarchaeota archaeon]|nr:hypothetical protein [Candidatus Bathyarchaeota archaeon]